MRRRQADLSDAELLLYFGNLLYYLNCPDEAESVYQDGLELRPNDVSMLLNLASLHLDKFDDGGAPDLYWSGRDCYRRAEDLLKEQSKSGTDASPFLQLGSLYIRLENYDAAEKACRQALELDDDLADAYTNLGVISIRGREYAAAIRHLESALRIEPNDLLKRSNLAEAYRKAEQFDLAEEKYMQVLKIAPEHLESRIGLGECYSAMADGGDKDLYEDAITYFTEAIKSRRSISASKALSKKALADVYYSRGYARVKQYEASKFGSDGTLLQDALEDFKLCFKLNNDHYKAKHAADKIEKKLDNSSPQQLAEKFGPALIALLSLAIFLLAQFRYFGSHAAPHTQAAVAAVAGAPAQAASPSATAPAQSTSTPGAADKNEASMPEGYYVLLTFGSLLFMVTGLYLPQILKLKVGSIELEKSVVDHAAPSSSLGIKRGSTGTESSLSLPPAGAGLW